jgi:hypothetical protein
VSTTQHVSRRRHVTADHVVSPANPASGGFLTAMGAGRAINLSREERQVGVKAAPSLNQHAVRHIAVGAWLDDRHGRLSTRGTTTGTEAAAMGHVVAAARTTAIFIYRQKLAAEVTLARLFRGPWGLLLWRVMRRLPN